MNDAAPLKVERIGRIGYLTLDKPRALNALEFTMVRELHRGLKQHTDDDNVAAIVIRSSSDRAFCAGGDVKQMRELVLQDEQDQIRDFFTLEYALNLAIARCKKPYIALLDGIAMGGGLGISVHGSHRIVTERARLAMPEARIGLFTDVGGTYFLPRLPRRAGWWLAMCSSSVRGHEAVQCGLGTHYMDSNSLPKLYRALEDSSSGNIDTTLATFTLSLDATEDSELSPQVTSFGEVLRSREKWFSGDSASDALTALKAVVDSSEDQRRVQDASELLSQLETSSPHSIKLTERLFTRNGTHDLEACLETELQAIVATVQHPDFAEGVRALLVDKDNAPQWQLTG